MSNRSVIAKRLKIDPRQVNATIELLNADNTIPFISRYRKEVTGGLDEEQIRNIRDLLVNLRTLDDRRKTVLKTIQGQGALTDELRAQIEAAGSRTELEDLYQPYKPKRKTRASVARDRGLTPLADLILKQGQIPEMVDELAKPYLSEDVLSIEDAWAGARDIVAEIISDHSDVRRTTRNKAGNWGSTRT
jgi:uncharacterized protein